MHINDIQQDKLSLFHSFAIMSDIFRNDDDNEYSYQRRSVVRFHDTIEVVDGRRPNDHYSNKDYEDYDDEYYQTIDIEAPVVPDSVVPPPIDVATMHDSTEEAALAAMSDEESVDDLHETDDNDDNSSSGETSKPGHTADDDWISFLHRSYGFIVMVMGMWTAIVSRLCTSKAEITDDDLMAATSMVNGDKAFFFVGSDGGSSYISYVGTKTDSRRRILPLISHTSFLSLPYHSSTKSGASPSNGHCRIAKCRGILCRGCECECAG